MDYQKLIHANAKKTDLTIVLKYRNIGPMKRLRLIRERRGLSLRALKKASSVAVSNLFRYEAGEGDPRLSTVRKVAKALDVSVCTLIGESKPGKGVKKKWD